MAREPVVIGPFGGGLNTYDDPTAVRDDELVTCLNWDPGLEGSLRSRPPFSDLNKPMTLGAVGDVQALGFFIDAGSPWLLASDGSSKTYAYFGGAWVVVSNKFAASAMVQFDNKAWLVAPTGTTENGGYWTPLGGFTEDANMPHGESIVGFKSRLWITPGKGNANGSRVYYSKVLGQPNFWQTPSFIDVGQGDGQEIVLLSTYYSNLVIFRTQSIHSFAYTSDPAQGIVNLLVPNIGLTSKECLISYENYLYFMYDEKAYQFVNNNAEQINLKVPFISEQPVGISRPFAVSLFNNRAIFHYYDQMFVYSLRTKTWTQWHSQTHGAIGRLMSPSGVLTDEAFAFPSASIPAGAGRTAKMLYIRDRVTNDQETMVLRVQTKNFNFQNSSNYKRLFWWGVDAVFRTNVRAWAVPIVQRISVTWGQLLSQGATWGQMLTATWGAPLATAGDAYSENDLAGAGANRKFVKLFKSLRFRQIYFRLEFDTDGSRSTAPVNLFSITAYMETKETVSKTVS